MLRDVFHMLVANTVARIRRNCAHDIPVYPFGTAQATSLCADFNFQYQQQAKHTEIAQSESGQVLDCTPCF